ncbi:MAG: PASTA domain-containing protein [Clostridiales bacterium]|nr:PASTA domain-containing protein [Clostridiales bacterium]
MKTLCLGCMEEYDGQGRFCPICGYDQTTPPAESHYLKPGTVIHGRYRVGRVLGSGGFGITYIAYDLTLQKKNAIKEYLPMEFATRIPNQSRVSVYKGEKQEQFEAGMHKSLDEAKLLAEFRQISGITQIYDFFQANNTAYIVMELLEGETLKDRLKRTGVMTVDEAFPIILAVTRTLKEVHAKHIIHRDIAPDNIYLLKTGEVKLLDFGASRQVTTTNSKSLTVILKAGYAPVEQYQSGGRQGPWTDIYALAATFYKMITGRKPPDSWDRRIKDTLEEPSDLGVVIDKNLENALLNALQVRIEDRTKSAEEFEKNLCSSHVERTHPEEKDTEQASWKWPLWLKLLFGIGGIAIIAGVVVLVSGIITAKPEHPGTVASEKIQEGFVRVPNLLNLSQDEAKNRVEEMGLVFYIAGTEPSDTTLKGYVLRQIDENGNSLMRGDPIEEGSTIQVIVSSGNGQAQIPDVLYMTMEAAVAEMNRLDLTAVNIETAEEAWAPKGTVTAVSPSVGAEVSQDTIITLTIAGDETVLESHSVTIPDLSGLSQDEAWELLKENELYMEKSGVEYQAGTRVGQILSQKPRADSAGNSGDRITVVVSAGPRDVQLADLTGLSEEEARKQLEGLGLIAGDSITRYDEESAPGTVLGQSVEPGILSEGETIILTVSLGAAPQETTIAPVTSQKSGSSHKSGSSSTRSATEAASAAPPETLAQEATQAETTSAQTQPVETTPAATMPSETVKSDKTNIW